MKQSKKGLEWTKFALDVLAHVENYTVPQYGDTGDSDIDNWAPEDCILAIKKYTSRFGRNSRPGQGKLDMLKIAHYACFVFNKLDERGGDEKDET